MTNIRFSSREHMMFFSDMLEKCQNNDEWHQAFFYVLGIADDTRSHIDELFDFANGCIKPEGLNNGWQTSSTIRICKLAFNLWNGYNGDQDRGYTPDDLFCCSYAPYFVEGVKLRYPEYFY